MNIKKFFTVSLRTVQRSTMPQVVSGMHSVRAAGVSLGTFLSDKGWKKISDKNGNIRIYDFACDFFDFNIRKFSADSFEKYLESVSVSKKLTGDEFSCIVNIFKLAALKKLADCCEMYNENVKQRGLEKQRSYAMQKTNDRVMSR